MAALSGVCESVSTSSQLSLEAPGMEEGEASMLSESLPLVRCKKCGIGTMLPLSDYGQDGAAILYKAWVCDSPTCGYNLRIDRGQVTYGDVPQPKSTQDRVDGQIGRASCRER